MAWSGHIITYVASYNMYVFFFSFFFLSFFLRCFFFYSYKGYRRYRDYRHAMPCHASIIRWKILLVNVTWRVEYNRHLQTTYFFHLSDCRLYRHSDNRYRCRYYCSCCCCLIRYDWPICYPFWLFSAFFSFSLADFETIPETMGSVHVQGEI